jgi:predicted amidohydrolase
MKVAAYQAPLAGCADAQIISLIRQQVDRCEALGVEFLCCPEAVVGGLADHVDQPERIAIDTSADGLDRLLAPLASDRVTTVIGFTELGGDGNLYNAAAVFARGSVQGIYRKVHTAINRSVYRAGVEAPVFAVGEVTLGVLICRDSLFREPAGLMASRGARLLLVPTNNGMPAAKGGPELVLHARTCDVARAAESRMPIVRADVAGVDGDLISYGSSGIVNGDGQVLGAARALEADLVIADVDIGEHHGRRPITPITVTPSSAASPGSAAR